MLGRDRWSSGPSRLHSATSISSALKATHSKAVMPGPPGKFFRPLLRLREKAGSPAGTWAWPMGSPVDKYGCRGDTTHIGR